jgi:chromosome segregation ATPase
MKNLNTILNIVLLIIVGFVLYFVISGNKNLKETQKKIIAINNDLTELNDSIHKTQKELSLIMSKLDFAENELKILKNERDLLELEEKKKMAANWEELQLLKKEIQDKEDEKNKLKENANKLEL